MEQLRDEMEGESELMKKLVGSEKGALAPGLEEELEKGLIQAARTERTAINKAVRKGFEQAQRRRLAKVR